jgi:hypothetical protein
MVPTYLNQHYLRLPQTVRTGFRQYTILPQPNVIDQWIHHNQGDAWSNGLVPGYLFLSDTPQDQVLCTLQLSKILVLLGLFHLVHLYIIT